MKAAIVATIYTIGHSTRTLDELVRALKAHDIRALADIRAFPVSRRVPHFNREVLEGELPAHGIEYRWVKELGGYRKKILDDSPNVALRNESFRNYADYMMSEEFVTAVSELARLAERSPTAYMCAERSYLQCHRRLVSDWLFARGNEVLHIDGEGPTQAHTLTSEARLVNGQVIYSGDRLF